MTKQEYDTKLKRIKEKNKQQEMKNKLREERKKIKVKNGKIKTSNIVLLATIFAIVVYTIVCLYIQYSTAMEVSNTLTQLWFTFWTVEITALTGIKVTKVIKNKTVENEILNESDCTNETNNEAKG